MPRKPAAARKPAAKKAQPSAARRLSSELPAPPSKRAGGADLTLRCLGFCGADDSADPASLRAISEAHEWVEWGVLFRPDKAGHPRYASAAWLRRLAKANGARRMRLAAHLCGARVDEVLRSLREDLPLWKPNSALIAIDFCVRHGLVDETEPGYGELVRLLDQKVV